MGAVMRTILFLYFCLLAACSITQTEQEREAVRKVKMLTVTDTKECEFLGSRSVANMDWARIRAAGMGGNAFVLVGQSMGFMALGVDYDIAVYKCPPSAK